MFLLSLAVLLGLAKLLGETARRLGQPSVLGEILAGVLLGQTVFAQISPEAFAWLFPETLAADGSGGATGSEPALSPVYIALSMLMTLSVTFLLLVAGLEVDLSVVWRQGKAAASVSVAGMVVPFALGFGAAWMMPGWMGFEGEPETWLTFALFLGIAMSITALPVIAKILMDLNLFRSDMGMLIMSAAMVNDLLGWLGFAVVLALLGSASAVAGSLDGLGVTIGATLAFCALMLTVGRWAVDRVLPWIMAHASWPGGVLAFVLTVGLACGALTEAIGIHAIFGAFLAGVAIGDSQHLRERTRQTIEQFANNFFAPIFFAGVGLRVNFIEGFDAAAVGLVLVIAIVGKVVGCYAGAKLAGLGRRESWAVGFGMSARGAMEIILGQIALRAGLIGETLFVAIVVMAIVTSLLAGPGMQAALRRRARRTLADVVTADRFAGVLSATDRREAIRLLSQTAAQSTGLAADAIFDAAWQRERVMSTGIGDGLAVPHARVADLKGPVVVLGLVPEGIDFDARDGTLAEIICLILTPVDDHESQIEMLDLIARTLGKPEARQQVLRAANPTQFRAALAVAVGETGTH